MDQEWEALYQSFCDYEDGHSAAVHATQVIEGKYTDNVMSSVTGGTICVIQAASL